MDFAATFNQFLHLPDPALYGALFAAALLENVLPPLPGDAVVAFGGYLAGTGRLSLPLAFGWVTFGSWCGFMCYYGLGRFLGRTRLHARVAYWASEATLERAEAWVRRYGYGVVLGNRLLVGARSVISLVAGFTGLAPLPVAALALASAAAWNVLLVGAGYAVGEAWESALARLGNYQLALTLTLAAAALLWWAQRALRGRRRKIQDPNTVSRPEARHPPEAEHHPVQRRSRE